MHRPPDDRALDLRAGVDPDDRGGVVDRVEVVPPRGGLERLLAVLRPDRRLLVVQRDPGPRRRVSRMRTDENARPRRGARRDRRSAVDPAADEGDLVRARRSSTSRHRARSDGRPADPPSRQNSARDATRLPLEPVVVRPGSEDVDAVSRDPVQLDRLVRLQLVPDEHELGQLVDEALVRQVVPAEDRIAGMDPEPLRRSDVVDLDRVARQVRDHQHVRARSRRGSARCAEAARYSARPRRASCAACARRRAPAGRTRPAARRNSGCARASARARSAGASA